MAERKTFGADIRISAVGLFAIAEGAHDSSIESVHKLRLGRLETDSCEGQIGSLTYRAAELSVDTLQTVLGRAQTSAESADVSGLEVTSSDGNIAVTAGRIGFPRGLLWTQNEELFAPHASVEDARVVIHDLGKLLARGDSAGPRMESEPASRATGPNGETAARQPMNWGFLDSLAGNLDLDLVVDMTLPWIGRRRATHYFRIPIENGTINYEKLEADVHWLEGAFLTVELVDDKLVLARDLPLVPYAGKALLVFPLEPEDVAVAAYRRVHLRNLFRGRRPLRQASGDKEKGKSRLTLHALGMENVKIALRSTAPATLDLPNGATLQVGDDDEPGLAGLSMAGDLRYEAKKTTEPTTLSGHIELMDLTVKDLPLGPVAISADRLHLSEIENIALVCDGFKPRSLELSVSRIAASNLRIQLK